MLQAIVAGRQAIVEDTSTHALRELTLDQERGAYRDPNGQYYRIDAGVAHPLAGVPPYHWTSRHYRETATA